jgi:hypothetical protein
MDLKNHNVVTSSVLTLGGGGGGFCDQMSVELQVDINYHIGGYHLKNVFVRNEH